jgi:TolB-like protein/Flp pilus assembly protein TadD
VKQCTAFWDEDGFMGHSDSRIRFAHFEADLRSGELFKDGVKVPLQEKPFQILALVLNRAPEEVTREEIFTKVWGNTYVERRLSLNTAVRKLRIALGDGVDNPQVIETTAKGYRLVADVRPVYPRQLRVPTSKLRLAVAPFQNLGGEAQEYFAEGLTEQMIARLGHTQKQISVIAPFSTMQYKRSGKSAAEIGREFSADYVLAGSVRLEDGVVNVAAMLIHTRDQATVWSENYRRDEGDIFAIEDEIANRIARSILMVLGAPDIRARTLSTTPAAYEQYLRGRFFANKWTAEGIAKAIEFFQQAIAADPQFAPAHAALATLYMAMTGQGIMRPDVINRLTMTAASEALRLCPDLADAHVALAWAQIFYEGDWKASERSFQRAIELNPSSNTAYEGYAHLLTAMARHEDAIKAALRACELDPLSPFAANVLACSYYFARRNDDALRQLLRNFEMEPAFPIAHSSLGWVYQAMGRMEDAIACQRRSVAQNAGSPVMLANLAQVLGVAGYRDEARSLLQEVMAARESTWIPPYWIALLYLGLGEHTTALEWLTAAVEQRDGWRVFCGVEPKFDPLRDDSRFQALVKRVGLPVRAGAKRTRKRAAAATSS